MKILGGVMRARPPAASASTASNARAMTVADAIAAGIAFVHQELNLFDNLDAAANVFIGREPRRGPLRLLDRRRMRAEVAPLFARLGVDFGPDTPVAGCRWPSASSSRSPRRCRSTAASSSWTSRPRA